MFERLEDRNLLSGNVLASVAGGALVILGDRFDNDIVVAAGNNPGEVVVSTGQNNTTINGQAGPLTLTGFTGGCRILLRQGSDTLKLSGLTVAGNLTVDGGVGDNTITIDSGTTVRANLWISSNGCLNTTILTDLTVGGSVSLNGFRGDDVITADALSVAQALTIRTGWGNDTATLTNCTVGHAATFGGTDVSLSGCTLQGMLTVNAGPLDGNVTVQNTTVAKALAVHAGPGPDAVSIQGSTLSGAVTIFTGLGADTVSIDGTTVAGCFSLDAGGGNDTVTVATTANTTFAKSTVFLLRPGNDALTVGSSQAGSHAIFQAAATFDGGMGANTLAYLANGNVFQTPPKIRGFQTIQ
jgi:hypothetical protein